MKSRVPMPLSRPLPTNCWLTLSYAHYIVMPRWLSAVLRRLKYGPELLIDVTIHLLITEHVTCSLKFGAVAE